MIAGLDFKNPVGIENFNCFKKVCHIKRNTNENSRSYPTPRKAQRTGVKKPVKSCHKIQQLEDERSGSETEITVWACTKTMESPSRTEVPMPAGK